VSGKAGKIVVIAAVVISAVLITLPRPQKDAVRGVIAPVLLLPINLGNTVLYNFSILKTNLTKYDEKCNNLALENALLAERLRLASDSLREELTGYTLTSARIINRDLVTMNRLLFLDRGSGSGIDRDMPVMYGGSAVGKVTDISRARSTVTTILSPGFRVSARIKRSGVFCMTLATNEGLVASYIQKDGDVREGDTVITSGLSDIMPPGLAVATVAHLEDSDDMFFRKVSLKTMTDIAKLRKVYVIVPGAPPVKAGPGRTYDMFKGIEPRAPDPRPR
jgi:rod shape-determining protein MreC